MLSRIIRLAALAAASAALVAIPSGANAGQGSGWTPYEQPDIDYAAGFRCEFAMHGEVLKDHEEFKDVAFWPDGSGAHPAVARGTGDPLEQRRDRRIGGA